MRNRIRSLMVAATLAAFSVLSTVMTVLAATGGGDWPLKR